MDEYSTPEFYKKHTCIEHFVAAQAAISESQKVRSVNARIKRIIQDYENCPILEYLHGIA